MIQNKNTKNWLILIAFVTIAIVGYLFLKNSGKPAGSEVIPSLNPTVTTKPVGYQFSGEKGQTLSLEEGVVKIDASVLNDNIARFYNVQLPSGKIIYFFIVKDQFGTIRAAANACQVCFAVRKGFHQEGNEIVCNNCGNRYPLEKIATEKGGCNPGPINPNLKIVNGKINITQTEIEQVSDLF